MDRTRRTRSNIYFNLETRKHFAFAESAGAEKVELFRSEIFRQDRIAYRASEKLTCSPALALGNKGTSGRDEPHEETNEGSEPAD